MNIPKKVCLLLALLSSLALTGCETINSQVTPFHKLEKAADGRYGTYAFFIPPEKQGNLEFETNLNRVRAYLNRNGFFEAPNRASADMLAFLNYSIISGGSTSTYRPPFVAKGDSAFAKGFNAGSGGGTGSITTSDMYIRTINLRLAKVAAAGSPLQTVYDGTIVSQGESGDMNSVMPTMIKALFVEFPGRTGESVRRDLQIEK